MNTKQTFFSIVLISFCTIFLLSCKKDPVNTGPGGTNPPTPTKKATISGVVVDDNNYNLSGVLVSLQGTTLTTTTNQFGAYNFNNAPVADKVSLVFSKPGYMKVARSEKVKSGITSISAMLLAETSAISATSAILAISGGQVQVAGKNTSVKLKPNSIVDAQGKTYSGNCNVKVAYLDPTADNFSQLIPGGDMSAINNDGNEGVLYSYGIIKVELTDDAGKELQVNQATEIEVGVPSSMKDAAPATIPLWHFDEAKGIWIEEGTAVLNSEKTKYVGTVTHFTDWNCDVWTADQAIVKGKVTNTNGNPCPGVHIRMGQSSTVTDENGEYQRRVPSGVEIIVKINNYHGVNDSKNVGTINPGETKTADFTISLNSIKGKLVNCSGQGIKGTIGFSWINNGNSSAISNDNGDFVMMLPSDVTNGALWAITGTGYGKENKTLTFSSGVANVGEFKVCEVVTGPNEFVINGGGFVNKKFSDFNEAKTAQYMEMNEPGLPEPIKRFSINCNGGNNSFYISISGKDVGTYKGDDNTTNQHSQVFVYINVDGVCCMLNSTLTVNLTKVGNVGGLVEGTFSGIGINHDNPGVTYTITNGKFSVVRMPDMNR